MWGSDYPRTMTAITYWMGLDFVEKSHAISHEKKALFLGQNATAFYRFADFPIPCSVQNMVEE